MRAMNNNKNTATPTGGVGGNFTYKVNEISVVNTKVKSTENVPLIQNTPDDQLSLAKE